MTDQTVPQGSAAGASDDVTAPAQAAEQAPSAGGAPAAQPQTENPAWDQPDAQAPSARELELEAQVAERTSDLQRLQADYVNYKRRVDRDRDVAKQSGIERVVVDLLPVFDSIDAADDHGDLTGGFKLVADELQKVATKHGLESFGAVGDAFDPTLHDALMQMAMDGIDVTTVAQVMQRGYLLNGRVLRPAGVAVAEPSN